MFSPLSLCLSLSFSCGMRWKWSPFRRLAIAGIVREILWLLGLAGWGAERLLVRLEEIYGCWALDSYAEKKKEKGGGYCVQVHMPCPVTCEKCFQGFDLNCNHCAWKMWSKCRNWWCSAHRVIHRWINYPSDGHWTGVTRRAVFIRLWMLKLINDIGGWMLKLPELLLGRQWQTTQCNPLIDSGR